jgi:hypothetical protein
MEHIPCSAARQNFAMAAGLDARVMKIRVTQTLKRAA